MSGSRGLFCLLALGGLAGGCRLENQHLSDRPGWVSDLHLHELPPALKAQTARVVAEEYERIGNFSEAAQYLELTRSLEPHAPGILPQLARLYDRAGNPESAEAVYREALRRSPLDGGLRHQAGRFFLRHDQARDGLEQLQEAARLSPERPAIWEDLARALVEQDRPADAMLTLSAHRGEGAARMFVARVLVDAGRRGEAKAWAARAVEAEPRLRAEATALLGIPFAAPPAGRDGSDGPIRTVGGGMPE